MTHASCASSRWCTSTSSRRPTIEEGTDIISAPWRTEYDVISTLTAMGHEVKALGVHDDLGEIRRLVTEWKPQIAFNLLEGFDDVVIFDQNVVSHLELLKLPYTGCNSRGHAAGARQVALQEAARLPPHPRAGVRGVSAPAARFGGPSAWRSR